MSCLLTYLRQYRYSQLLHRARASGAAIRYQEGQSYTIGNSLSVYVVLHHSRPDLRLFKVLDHLCNVFGTSVNVNGTSMLVTYAFVLQMRPCRLRTWRCTVHFCRVPLLVVCVQYVQVCTILATLHCRITTSRYEQLLLTRPLACAQMSADVLGFQGCLQSCTDVVISLPLLPAPKSVKSQAFTGEVSSKVVRLSGTGSNACGHLKAGVVFKAGAPLGSSLPHDLSRESDDSGQTL